MYNEDDIVICVNDEDTDNLKLNCSYTVYKILFLDCMHDVELFIELKELKGTFFYHERFRPILSKEIMEKKNEISD